MEAGKNIAEMCYVVLELTVLFHVLGFTGGRAFGYGGREKSSDWAEDVFGAGNQKARKSITRLDSQQKQEQ